MAIKPKRCPFSNRACADCSLYIGRHYYTDFANQCSRNTDGRKKKYFDFDSIPLMALSKIQQEEKDPGAVPDSIAHLRLKVINLVTEQVNSYSIQDAISWRWDDPEVQRFINGSLHVTSLSQLLDYCQRRVKKGKTEILIYESPGYLMISGG